MSTPLAQDKTLPTLAAVDDRLHRQMDELKELRKTVAEAERSRPDQEQRPRARPLS